MSKCIIIGGGPAGMSASLYLARAGAQTIIIEKGALGGELLKIDKIDNYLGLPSINGGDLAINMSGQVKDMGVRRFIGDVRSISKSEKGFTVDYDKGSMECDYVILASGKKPNMLGVPREEDFIGHGVSYCATCDGAFYKGMSVCVVGGGDGAFSEALYLAGICEKVYVLVRGQVRAGKVLKERVKEKENIVIIHDSVKELIGNKSVSGVVLESLKTLQVSGVFVSIGGRPQTDILSSLDVKLKNGYVVTDENMESSVSGLYAIGDVRYKDFYQVVTAVSDGAICGMSIGGKL